MLNIGSFTNCPFIGFEKSSGDIKIHNADGGRIASHIAEALQFSLGKHYTSDHVCELLTRFE